MRTAVLVMLIAVLSLGLAGCQKDEKNADPDQGNTIRVRTPHEAEEFFKTFAVECDDPSTCNPSVALLISNESATSLSVCTASLVGPDYIFTNKHCLPTDLMKAGASCGGRVLLKFPKTDTYEEVWVPCETVAAVSPYDVTKEAKQQVDYAFLKLQRRVERPVLSFDTSGVEEGEILKVTRMSPYIGLRKGVISDLHCKAVQSTVITPLFNSRFSPVVHVNDCPIVKGNSGSSMFGSDGRIKAIIQQGKNDPAAEPALKQTFGRGSNAACIGFAPIHLSAANEADCRQDLSDEAADRALDRVWEKYMHFAELEAELQKQIAIHVDQAPKILQWKTEEELMSPAVAFPSFSGGVLMTWRLTPKCISPFDAAKNDSWIASYRSSNEGGEDSRTSAPSFVDMARVDLQFVSWALRWDLDENLRPRARIEERLLPGSMFFSPRTISMRRAGEFILQVYQGGETFVARTRPLPICSF